MPAKIKSLTFIPLALAAISLAACVAAYKLPAEHPEELDATRPVCTDCHDASDGNINYARFTHTISWGDNHRLAAYQNEQVCAMCHQQSYCNDCHGVRVELKPSTRSPDEVLRQMPHRGDFLSRHRIEGRINPTSCFRCHGNPKTAQTCAPCHG
ncbi:MAG: cytochrome C [Desulfuromonas sp.]|nr:MAG: cytochrome C [Desulfuromonas sp.]